MSKFEKEKLINDIITELSYKFPIPDLNNPKHMLELCEIMRNKGMEESVISEIVSNIQINVKE